MSKENNKQRSYLQIIRLPTLIATAIVIIALCFILFTWNQEADSYQSQEFDSVYNQGMADLSAAFLGHLIEDENTETIESIGHRLADKSRILQVAIYRRNGELIYSAGSQDQSQSEPVIANISYEDSYNGYLVLYFAPSHSANINQPLWLHSSIIWFFGAALWVLIFLVLNIKRAKKKPAEATEQTLDSAEAQPTAARNGQVLKDLIKRNKQQLKGKTIKHSLVISAEWGKLDDRRNALLLRVLSRWLPQNGLLATQFSGGLLVLGLDSDKAPLNRNPLFALERCLKQLQLQPKILLHRLNFDRDIYQMF
ncbi:hypothetical protein DZA50_03690, partial [Kangiella sp. HD9-110m-PIT-SAG07]